MAGVHLGGAYVLRRAQSADAASRTPREMKMKTSRPLIIRAIVLLLGSSALAAQPIARRVQPALPGIDSLAATEFAKDSIGSITVGVIAGGDLIWTKSYGFANMSTRKHADRNTVYRIGSITKPFTAVM